ncbi:MAG TPA: alanine--tRNA ligase [Candidatus Acidoferrales bacterium]|nr:alanine--tRNA ligase [Candidatus Acidoferrales bacterium]
MTGHEIRQRYLDFFAERGHRIVRSGSLVPANDPTLLFTNAGMVQFKDVFLGNEKRDYARATTSQKCVRAGGKHNDLENVGYTRRHHTFFEMLGNFSFGDYFKADAIDFAWQLITKDYGLPKDKLYVTVFREDDEAEELWQKVAGVPKSRIFRLDEEDNFWQMGDTGPCGPCSEIHYDMGVEAAEPGREHEEFPSDAGGRFVEFWNLVFMQFDRDSGGQLTPLPRPSIDTGLGLERMAAMLQGKFSNYDTDLIRPIIENAAELFGVTPGGDARVDTALRIAADHARATAFLIHDGVVPANEGRGYVLRKIMRRAMRNVRLIGVEDQFLYKMTGFVAELMQPAYPEMMESVQRVARVVKDEEHRYATTFLQAEKQFNDAIQSLAGQTIPGAVAFKLYDTFGLALDEQEDMAREHAPPLAIDHEGFNREMQQQRERARASWKGAEKGAVVPAYQKLLERGRTRFLGYTDLESTSRVIGLLVDKQPVDVVPAGAKAELVFDQTPFYAETGGQVGDRGDLYGAAGDRVAEVETVFPGVPGLSVHRILTHAPIAVGDILKAEVAAPLRDATRRNHTATHLLHAGLRQVLGKHVKQAGSVVEPGRLRFDFTHYTGLDRAELDEVERLMNEQILKNTPVDTNILPLDQAIATGAMALFGEKYGEEVRVVSVPGFSRELCGGTHVRRTGDIGVCKVVYEGSISAGVRRIEAITGEAALRQYQESTDAIRRIAGMIKASEPELVEHVERLLAGDRALEKQVIQLKEKLAQAAVAGLEAQAVTVKDSKILVARVDSLDRQQMRTLADSLRNQWKSAVLVLASAEDGAVSIVAAVTKDLTGKVQAGKLVSAVAQAVGGKGGGRPDMAEGGGKDAAALDGALDKIRKEIATLL